MKKVAIHCPTELSSKLLLKYFHSKGLKWCSGNSYLEENYWNDYKQNTCYCPDEGTYCPINFFKLRIYDYEVISVEAFLKLSVKYLL